jgi:glycosyltransferase involved in cell wall biosynthesis
MNTPLVSVIMTAYNCEKFVEESLVSIFKQTFQDLEIIVYDDFSTDSTLQVIRNSFKYFNGTYSIIRNNLGYNTGCGEGRNKSINYAKGKYIIIQDADDVSFLDRIEKEINILESNDDIFCVSAWADIINENGEKIGEMRYPPKDNEDIRKEMLIKHNNPIIDPASMFRRDIFNKLGGYKWKWQLVPDFNLWARAVKKGYKFANIQEPLVCYRQHPDSVTNKYETEVVKEHFKMCREVFKKK